MFEGQLDLDPDRLVFIDETWASTNTARRHGRFGRGERLRASVPHGHCKTTIFVAGLRNTGMVAPMLLDGPINRDAFTAYVNQVLVPGLSPATSSSWTICRATRGRSSAIFWRLRADAPWSDIPVRYGPHTTCVNRFNRWRKAGHWARILEAVSAAYAGDIQMIDSSSIRVHQHAANAKKRWPIPLHGSLARRPDDKDPRARRCARPADLLKLTQGQAHNGRSADDMLDGLADGDVLLADRAYDSDAMRANLEKRGAWACVKPMPNRKNIPPFSSFLYRSRNLVERFFNKLNHFRAVATRYDKRDDNFLASVQLASIRIRLRHNESVTSSVVARQAWPASFIQLSDIPYMRQRG